MSSSIVHRTAKPSHYDDDARDYDAFQDVYSDWMNVPIEKQLRKYKAKRVLDLTCGTGLQVFYLADRGYEVTGADFNAKMLRIARKKAKDQSMNIHFVLGDMRKVNVGLFDAVISISNAIGHLTRADFEKTIRNVRRNLKPRGLYIFDIFDLAYFSTGNHISELTIDWISTNERGTQRVVQYSAIEKGGILASYTTNINRSLTDRVRTTTFSQTLQIYTAKQLRAMLMRNGFEVLEQMGMEDPIQKRSASERILTVAQRMR